MKKAYDGTKEMPDDLLAKLIIDSRDWVEGKPVSICPTNVSLIARLLRQARRDIEQLENEIERLNNLTIWVSCSFCGGSGNNPYPLEGPKSCGVCYGKGLVQGRTNHE